MPGLAKEVKICTTAASIAASTAKKVKTLPLTRKSSAISPLSRLRHDLREYIEEKIDLCKPKEIHVCSGSKFENEQLLHLMANQGTIRHLRKYDNCWLARTNPKDVARVESRTFMCSERKEDTVPRGNGVTKLANWISPTDYAKATMERFPGCMKGRTMYIIPFSMGPVGSPLSKVGVELTDSPYVAASMRIMTRVGASVLDVISKSDDVVKCLHSVGTPVNGRHEVPSWPCDPERTIIMHKPAENEIISYGSGYGGNSLLGKKGFALRIGSTLAKQQGWLAEHMLIVGITNPAGVKHYIAAAFPSACGKTNLAMLRSSLPGYKVECVGDDIAWMRFDSKGVLRAINPENGFFGVAPGTSNSTNPNAMKTIFKNTVFTNVASTGDGGVYWEGMDKPTSHIVDWKGRAWNEHSSEPAAHPNSRFCSPAVQCPIMDPHWEDPEGVPISAILFGGRRPEGVPLVYEAFNWSHGVFMGASMRSEATAAAEHKGKEIMHDPFAMRPFFGYNFGHYLQHWLSMEQPGRTMPKIFHVNWFRKHKGQFLWPGFGENIRVLDWILKRVEGDDSIATTSPLGLVPTPNALPLQGMGHVDYNRLFDVPTDFWHSEIEAIAKYFDEQVGQDLPKEISTELRQLAARIDSVELPQRARHAAA